MYQYACTLTLDSITESYKFLSFLALLVMLFCFDLTIKLPIKNRKRLLYDQFMKPD